MWNWLSCFRYNPSDETKQNVRKAGMGLIEYDNKTYIFFSSCGYSFHSSHWIPFYLRENERLRKKYETETQKHQTNCMSINCKPNYKHTSPNPTLRQ